MGKNTNKILAAVAFLMVAAVVGALAYNFIKNNIDFGSSNNGFEYSEIKYDDVGNYKEGLIPAKIYNLWGYSDKKGKVMIVPQFAEAGDFSSELASVKVSKDGLYGYIDNSGELVIEPQFAYSGKFSDGLASCKVDKKDKLGYINKSGDYVIKPQYFEAGDFSEGLAKVSLSKDGLYGYIDKKGKSVIPAQFKQATDFSQGLAAVHKDGLWGFIDNTGKVVIAPKYTNAHTFYEGLAMVQLDGTWGYIDKTGNFVIKNTYIDAGDFSGEYAPVNKNGLWGYIDKKGESIIETKYQAAKAFSNGVATYMENGKWLFIIDKKYVKSASSESVSGSGNGNGNGTGTSAKPIETISNKNIKELIKSIKIHTNEAAQLSGKIKTSTAIEKLVLSVIGEDGKAKGVYLSVKPNTNQYDLNEVSIDGKIDPFNNPGKYTLQIWAKLKGASDESKIGEVGVEILKVDSMSNLALDVRKIDSNGYPLVATYASVLDKNSKPISNLTINSFKLYESINGQNEIEQKLETIKMNNPEEGLSIGLVLDSSLSMYNKDKTEKNSNMAFAKAAAIKFINSNKFSSKDKLSIMSFGKKFTVNQSFTVDKAKLVKAVNSIKSQPDTAIYDAVSKSVEELKKQGGKKCLIIFSDGEDTSSKTTYIDAVKKAIAVDLPIYTIALGQEGKTNEFKSISDKTNGAFYYLKDPKMLNQIYKIITEKQKNQYILTYKSNNGSMSDKNRSIRIVVTNGSESAEAVKAFNIR
jgi:VWFA-related protein